MHDVLCHDGALGLVATTGIPCFRVAVGDNGVLSEPLKHALLDGDVTRSARQVYCVAIKSLERAPRDGDVGRRRDDEGSSVVSGDVRIIKIKLLNLEHMNNCESECETINT